MITVYERLEKDFTHNGYGALFPFKAEITEELNGMYEMTLSFIISENKNKFPYIKEFNIIRAPSPRGYQLFRIYYVEKDLYTATIHARHIYYDSLWDFVPSLELIGASGKTASETLYRNALLKLPFKLYSNIIKTADVSLLDINPVYGILGDMGLISIFGGELLRDNYDIYYMDRIGEDKGVSIRYGKNLTGIDITLDTSNIITRIRPIGKQNDDTPLYLSEGYLDSPYINRYPYPFYGVLYCRDIKVTRNLSTSMARLELKKRAQAFFDSGGDLPSVNAKIDFVLLQETEEYKNMAPLESISLGDTVKVVHEALGIELSAKCIKYVYDCMGKRYLQAEIGSRREDFAAATGLEITKLVQGSGLSNPASVDDLIQRINTHVHNETDGTQKISYHNLKDKPS
ncbi:MAG: hypothetical protein E7234_11605 [Lachnospiraceae bacterium]|nr:hypothetical protein [Lachnospiraceae bacterium]